MLFLSLLRATLHNAPEHALSAAAHGLINNSLTVTLDTVLHDLIRGTVQKGTGRKYRTSIHSSVDTPNISVTCQCAAARRHGRICMHAVALALYAYALTATP